MANVARGDEQDDVTTNHLCTTTTKTKECSTTVFAEGYGVVRKGDKDKEHFSEADPCPGANHEPTLDDGYSSTVFADGPTQNVAMLGSVYGNDVGLDEEITNVTQTTVKVT